MQKKSLSPTKKWRAKDVVSGKRLNTFTPRSENDKDFLHSSLLLYIVLEVLASAIGKKKWNRKIGMEEIKSSLIADGM